MAAQIHILMIDDDNDDHFFFREALKNLNVGKVDVTSLYDGSQALDLLLRRGKYANTHIPFPDFIVLDLNMPVIDGWAVMNELKTHDQFRDIPIYVLTTSWQEAHKDECKQLGCAGFFSKPPDNEDLMPVIQKMLDDSADRLNLIH